MKTTLITTVSLLIFTQLWCQTVSTVTQGLFHDGLAVDVEGAIYGSDFTGDSVFKYSTDGTVTTFATGFTSPNGIGINPQGEIFICDHFGNTLYKYDSDGNVLLTFTGLTTPAGVKNIPETDDMLLVEYNTSAIKRVHAVDNTISTIVSGAPLNGPAGIAFVDGTAYIGNFNDRKVLKLEGDQVIEIAQLPAGAAQSNFMGFLTSFNGQLYATQIGEGIIYKIDPENGAVSVFAGSVIGNQNGPIATATFNQPNGIVGDDANNRIYVSDAGTKNLRIIDAVLLETDSFNKPNELLLWSSSRDSLQLRSNFVEGAFQLKIYNALGRMVYKEDGVSTTTSFNKTVATSQFANGTYILELISTKGKKTSKFSL